MKNWFDDFFFFCIKTWRGMHSLKKREILSHWKNISSNHLQIFHFTTAVHSTLWAVKFHDLQGVRKISKLNFCIWLHIAAGWTKLISPLQCQNALLLTTFILGTQLQCHVNKKLATYKVNYGTPCRVVSGKHW